MVLSEAVQSLDRYSEVLHDQEAGRKPYATVWHWLISGRSAYRSTRLRTTSDAHQQIEARTDREILCIENCAEGVIDIGQLDHEFLVPSREARGVGKGWMDDQGPCDTVCVLRVVCRVVRQISIAKVDSPTHNLSATHASRHASVEHAVHG